MDTQRNQTKKNINLRRHRHQLIVNSLALFVHLFLIVLHRRITISRIYTQQCAHTHTHQTKNDTLGGIIRHNLQGLPQNANEIIIKKTFPVLQRKTCIEIQHTHKKRCQSESMSYDHNPHDIALPSGKMVRRQGPFFASPFSLLSVSILYNCVCVCVSEA